MYTSFIDRLLFVIIVIAVCTRAYKALMKRQWICRCSRSRRNGPDLSLFKFLLFIRVCVCVLFILVLIFARVEKVGIYAGSSMIRNRNNQQPESEEAQIEGKNGKIINNGIGDSREQSCVYTICIQIHTYTRTTNTRILYTHPLNNGNEKHWRRQIISEMIFLFTIENIWII